MREFEQASFHDAASYTYAVVKKMPVHFCTGIKATFTAGLAATS